MSGNDDRQDTVKYKQIWHRQHDIVLKEWSEMCSSYRWLHYNCYRYYSSKNLLLTLPVIIITAIAGSLSFSQSGMSDYLKLYLSITIGCCNMFVTILSSVSQFLRCSELAENHRTSSISFGKLARSIKSELALPIKGRSFDGKTFIKISKIEIDRLLEQSSIISKDIIKKFEKKFNYLNISKPEILEIDEVKIFIDDDSQYLPYDHEDDIPVKKRKSKRRHKRKNKRSQEIEHKNILENVYKFVSSPFKSAEQKLPNTKVHENFYKTSFRPSTVIKSKKYDIPTSEIHREEDEEKKDEEKKDEEKKDEEKDKK